MKTRLKLDQQESSMFIEIAVCIESNSINMVLTESFDEDPREISFSYEAYTKLYWLFKNEKYHVTATLQLESCSHNSHTREVEVTFTEEGMTLKLDYKTEVFITAKDVKELREISSNML